MRDLLLAALLISSFPLILYRYEIGPLVIGFISFMYPQSNVYGFAFTIPWLDYFILVTFLSYFLRQGYKNYEHHTIINWMLLIFFWVCLTTVFSVDIDLALELWIKFAKVLILALTTFAILNTEKRLMAFLKVMVISFGFYGIKGGLFTLATGGGATVLGPVNSFFADTNRVALVLVMVLPFMIFFISHASNIYQKYFAIFCSLLTGVAILGTHSRTGFTALVITSLYFAWKQKKFGKSLLIILPLALVANFVMADNWSNRIASTTSYESDDSFQGRMDMWEASIKLSKDYPIMGGGYDALSSPEMIAKYVPLGVVARAIHSSYFQMIAEHGYVGLTIFLLILFNIFHFSRKAAKQSLDIPHLNWVPDLSVAIRCSTIGYMILSITSNIAFFDLFYFVIVILALTLVIIRKNKPKIKSNDFLANPA